MKQLSTLARSIRARYALLALTAIPMAAIAQDTSADNNEEEAQAAERIEVTGSRIKRTDMEGAVPVTTITRDQIDLSGDMSVSDLLRDTTFNSSGSFRPQSGSTAQGTSLVDLRGIGSERTLVLLDGRRLTMSPSIGSAQDLNSIPLGAIERIEILSDGASAVYGSDAIGGVINVITRKDYQGAEIMLGAGQVSVPSEGGDREQGSVLFGTASADTSVMGGVSWNSRDIVFARAYPWIGPGSSVYGNNWGDSPFVPDQAIPGGCTEVNFIPTTIDGAPRCQYNFNATNANEASSQNESLFLNASHQINSNWEIFSKAVIAETVSFGRYAPAPDTNSFYPSLTTPEDSYNNPTNPNAWMYDPRNPNSVAYDPDQVGPNREVYFFHRFAAMGNRDNTTTNNAKDFLLGFNGFIGDQEVEFGWRRVRNNSVNIGNGYLAATTAWSNVNDFNPGYCGDGTFDPVNCRFGYDIQNPSSNPDDVLSAGVVTTSRISDFDIDEYFGNVSFDIMETDAGMIAAFFGLEHRKERFSDQYDSQSEAGLVGGSSGSSAGGGRTVNAAFFEALIPVTYDFEINVAGRYDRYSDFGGSFSPKVSMRWNISDGLVARASWGEGFRAPSLDILTQKPSFSAEDIRDEDTCRILTGDPTQQCQVNTTFIANPDLEAEESEQIALGLSWDVTDAVNLTFDYYDITIDNRIREFTAQDLIFIEQAGDPFPAGLGFTRNPDTGFISSVTAGFANQGTLETSGLDVKANANWDFGSAGSLRQNLQVSYIDNLSLDSGRNLVNDLGIPEHRLTFGNVYSLNDLSFSYTLNLIGSTSERTVLLDNGGVEQQGHIGTYVTHDVQVSYASPWDSQVTFGIQNAFEKLPELYGVGNREYNYNLYDGWGRVYYVRFQQRF